MSKKDEIIKWNNLSDEAMGELLLELRGTQYWQAILRRNRFKNQTVLNAIVSLDPFKSPTEVARAQGISQETFGLESDVEILYNESKEKEREAESNQK